METNKVIKYFNGDELASSVWQDKYQQKGEKTPDDMHKRMAKEFAKVEEKYQEQEEEFTAQIEFPELSKYGMERNALTEEAIYNLFKNFKYVVPQGSVMAQLGANSIGSVSNCFRGDVKVLTRQGWKRIEELEGKEVEIMTKGGQWVKAPFKSYGEQQLCEVVLENGFQEKRLWATRGHRWAIFKEAKPDSISGIKITSELKKGDKLYSTYGKVRNWKLSSIGIAHGITYGDGQSVKGRDNCNSITLCSDSRELGKYFPESYVSSTENSCAGGSDLYSGLPNYFRELPDIEENKAYLYGWLAGYFAADGHIDKNGSVMINSSKKEDLLKVQDICGVLGISSRSITQQTVISNLTNKEHTMYKIIIHKNHLSKEFFLLEKHSSRFKQTNKKPARWKVKEVLNNNILDEYKEKVYCAEVPETESFVIEGNILSMNCFVISQPSDSYGGIFQTDEKMAQLMKRRGGVGIDVSTLRPSGTPTSNAAKTSTGAVSFMNRFSSTTREVAQAGRRGALMISMDINHPDILDFIKIKRDLTKITGANISIKINDEFMKAVEKEEDYVLRFPCDTKFLDNIPKTPIRNEYEAFVARLQYETLVPIIKDKKTICYLKKIKAKDYWNEIIKSAHNVAEPGLMFWDNMVNYSPDGVYPQFKQITTNPCCFGKSCRVDVITKEGIKDIKNITSNDLVWLQNENKFVPTKGYTNYGIAETYKVKFSNGEELVLTSNHKLAKIKPNYIGSKESKTEFELVKLEDLRKGDKICTSELQNKESLNYTKIVSIEYNGKEEVGCIEVPKYHYFTANSIISGNSEIGMQPHDACRLISVNLYSFVDNPFTDKAQFDMKKFYEVAYETMRLSDDLIDLEVKQIDNILTKIINDPEEWEVKQREYNLWEAIKKTAQSSRRTGVGFTALGDTLAALNMKYDSDVALDMTERIMQTKMTAELDCTIDLGILRGTFEGWNKALESTDNIFYNFLHKNFSEQYQRMLEYGRRNVSFSTVAPTGTVSLLTQTTSGIEPLFMPYYMRRKKVNQEAEGVRVDFTDQNGDKWQEYPVLHNKFKDWLIKSNNADCATINNLSQDYLKQTFEKSPWFKATANDIDWVKRVRLQAIIQKYITHSISSTINLPADVAEEEVSEIYLEAWKQGLKGITVYRDGSRSGVLVSNKKEAFEQHNAPKRPKELDADYYFATSKGRKYAVIIGLFEKKPYEVFVFEDPKVTSSLRGKIVKVKKGIYKFVSENYTIDNLHLASNLSDEKLLTRWISLALRHGANPKFIIDQTEKSELEVTAFAKVIVRTLKKYIANGETSTLTCESCGAKSIIFEEGCYKCLQCGNGKCG